ncbi:MAG: phosphate ABC transporter substrate-binding protein PstS [Streptosporangiales bacterium]|nr:phosphate ABC transporter substrate-binding protein PstS [Streptosporangiales bacterium]
MKLTTYGRIAGVAFAGALALSACGTDDNSGGGTSGGGAKAADLGVECVKGTINASGSSAQDNAMSEWKKAYQQACAGASINYQASGSGAGVEQFIAGSTAFAGSDSALKEDKGEPAKADARCKTGKAINLPMVVGPVSVVYNLPGVDGLQLSAPTLAKIFNGKVAKWNDPAIAKENQGVQLPATPIQPVHRADESGTTDNFTSFLKEAAPKDWPYEPEKAWPAQAKGLGGKSSEGLTTTTKQTTGAIGYVEYSFAKASQMQQAKIANGADEYVELTPESASKAVEGAEVEGEGNDLKLSIDYTTKAAGAYPIVLVTYEITCEKGLPADQLALTKSFLTYAASEQGQSKLTALGYAPVPQSVISKVRTSVQALS